MERFGFKSPFGDYIPLPQFADKNETNSRRKRAAAIRKQNERNRIPGGPSKPGARKRRREIREEE